MVRAAERTTHDPAAQAADAILEVERAGAELARLTVEEARLEHERHTVKLAAILRLMEQENPTTKKLHSATSAADYVVTDARYAAYLAHQREVTAERIVARTRLTAANLTAQLHLSRLNAGLIDDMIGSADLGGTE
jgi:hypothetical protein